MTSPIKPDAGTFTVRCTDAGAGAIALLTKGQDYQASIDPANPLVYVIRVGQAAIPFLRTRFDPSKPPLEAEHPSDPTPYYRGERTGPVCPTCGRRSTLTDTRFGGRHECCGLRSWGGKPLVDQRTIAARKAAHRAFDMVWQSRVISRSRAYARLAAHLGITPDECHMAVMDAGTAERVPAAVRELWPDVVKVAMDATLEEYGR